MMYYFDGVIIVEGKGDVSYLSSFIDSEYVVLNGYDMPNTTIDYLTHIKNRKILLCTDPDKAGLEIKEKFMKFGIQAVHILFDINKCNKNGKHGVAECDKEEVINKLKTHLNNEPIIHDSITKKEFAESGLMFDKNKQKVLGVALHLGDVNTKTLFKRLNYNNIKLNDIRKVLGE